jgi:hypothetical protein
MFKQKSKPKKSKKEDKFATQENPAVIFRPLSNARIIIGNLEEEDEYKTEPFLDKKPQ